MRECRIFLCIYQVLKLRLSLWELAALQLIGHKMFRSRIFRSPPVTRNNAYYKYCIVLVGSLLTRRCDTPIRLCAPTSIFP